MNKRFSDSGACQIQSFRVRGLQMSSEIQSDFQFPLHGGFLQARFRFRFRCRHQAGKYQTCCRYQVRYSDRLPSRKGRLQELSRLCVCNSFRSMNQPHQELLPHHRIQQFSKPITLLSDKNSTTKVHSCNGL